MADIYLENVLKKIIILGLLLFCYNSFGQADCQPTFKYTSSSRNGVINWQQFPDFTLPFNIIYTGPRFKDSLQLPLKHGFSHLANFTQFDTKLASKNRAILWGGVASLQGQPWYEIESPWNNDLLKYKEKWANDMKMMANMFDDTREKAMPILDILMLDIEREIPTDAGIRFLKADTTLPQQYRKLSDLDFTESYKKYLSKLYAEPVKYLINNKLPSSTKIASYSDAPIKNSEFPLNYTWQDWQISDKVLNYYMVDSVSKKVGGEFYIQNTFLAPSAYFCYEYSLIKDYPNVAYQLFQVESNIARSDKDVMLFEWLSYNKCQANSSYGFDSNLKKYLIEAQAIFPFFVGAKGVWLWENPVTPDSENYSRYETYINSLYRLSQFKDFFTGNYRLISPKSAHQNFQDKDPVWRGVLKGNEILIAAINEFAGDNESTDLSLTYGEWSQKITLKGKETFLCKFQIPDNQNNYTLYPNPSNGNFTFEYFGDNLLAGKFKIYDMIGNELLSQNVSGTKRKEVFDLKLPAGAFILKYLDGEKVVEKKIIIQ
jgi:hypothetical protein